MKINKKKQIVIIITIILSINLTCSIESENLKNKSVIKDPLNEPKEEFSAVIKPAILPMFDSIGKNSANKEMTYNSKENVFYQNSSNSKHEVKVSYQKPQINFIDNLDKKMNEDKMELVKIYYKNDENKNSNSDTFKENNKYFSPTEFILPHIRSHRNLEPINNRNRMASFCPCAKDVKCQPCNGFVNLEAISNRILSCPCAKNIKCPICPPLSILHEIASKKAEQDQKMASGLKGISAKITEALDYIIKNANDIIKFEQEAVEASKKMEDASLKAQIARNNMLTTSEKARFIAKTGIVDRNPCNPNLMPCNDMNPQFDFFSQKIFPEEVDDIKGFMHDTFTTNVNGYTDNLKGKNYNRSRGQTYYNGKGYLNDRAYTSFGDDDQKEQKSENKIRNFRNNKKNREENEDDE